MIAVAPFVRVACCVCRINRGCWMSRVCWKKDNQWGWMCDSLVPAQYSNVWFDE